MHLYQRYIQYTHISILYLYILHLSQLALNAFTVRNQSIDLQFAAHVPAGQLPILLLMLITGCSRHAKRRNGIVNIIIAMPGPIWPLIQCRYAIYKRRHTAKATYTIHLVLFSCACSRFGFGFGFGLVIYCYFAPPCVCLCPPQMPRGDFQSYLRLLRGFFGEFQSVLREKKRPPPRLALHYHRAFLV